MLRNYCLANLSVIVTFLIVQCKILPADDFEFFEKQVRPLLIEHCYECHSADEQSGSLRLDSATAMTQGGDTGPSIVKGDAAGSLLVRAIEYTDLNLQMPPEGKLAETDIAAIRKWISNGAADPRIQSAPSSTKSSAMSLEEARKFWSFQQVSKPSVPSVSEKNKQWPKTPIDNFILASLEKAGLQPAPKADKRMLIRRVTFDLTGLPPTIQEVENFVNDSSENAFEKVVNRLLASVQYGERYGRHWLDVARYADSNGLDENLAFGNAWRYRDYVVKSFNDDKPFDRFLQEQIAGDLLPDACTESKTGTGFLALGAKVLAEPDREKLTMDTIDEQIDATSKAFLGMTIACARCHDHKFDPILQEDYYGLAAIFKSTKTFGDTNEGAIKHWFEHSLASDEEKATIKKIDAEIQKAKSAATSFKNESISRIREEAESRAAKYLAAATQFSPGDSLALVEQIAEPLGLHARMLYHCRLHLAYTDDAIVRRWNRLSKSESPEILESVFQRLFDATKASESADDTAPSEVDEANSPDEFPEVEIKLAAEALADKSGFLTVPPQVEYAFNAETLATYYALMETARKLESKAPDEAAVMGVQDGTVLESLPLHIRGDHRNVGDPVQRGFPQAFCVEDVQLPAQQSGRLELANWLVAKENPLTSRVYVNRIWGWHFGRPIVGTTENFGLLGNKPTHPELLNWLAAGFIEQGWSTKWLHREIVLSQTYQMASVNPNAASDLDPENSLLWKFPMRRLDAEEIRDSILATAGKLDITVGGKTVPLRNKQFVFNHTSVDHTKYDSLRRAIYLPVIRNNLYPFFAQFDFPDPTMPTGKRQSTVVAPQALLMMNDPLIMDAAESFALLVLSWTSESKHRVDFAYRSALSRSPTKLETDRALEFLNPSPADDLQSLSDESEERSRWSLFCQSLMLCNEFVYVQ